MSVVSSDISLASSHRYSRIETSTERLEIEVRAGVNSSETGLERARDRSGSRPGGNAVAVVLSGQGRALAAAELASTEMGKAGQKGDATADAIESAAEEARKDPGNQLLIALVEYLTGKRLQLMDGKDCRAGRCESGKAMESGPAEPSAMAAPAGAPQPALSLNYERTHILAEHESTQFAAEGVIRTSDGKNIRFSVELGMQRSYYEESHLELRMGPAAQREDPLVINFSGHSAQLRDQRFEFDLNADGELEVLPMLANGSGYLVHDRNGDGKVNDGSELFGAISGDGYADLKLLDDDGNGWIDEADSASGQLYLWLPEADGHGKLMTLEEAGVAAVSTSSIATPFELRGQQNADLGAVRSTGLYLTTEDSVGTTQQIDLSV